MFSRSLLLAALLCSGSTALAADDEPSPPPRDAPAACVAPQTGHGLSKTLADGPQLLGTYVIANGKSVSTKKLKISAFGHFVPERLGSTRGEVVAKFEIELIDKGERLPVLSDNYDTGFAPGTARVGPYRVTTRVLTNKPLVYEAKVELLGCEKDATHKPLATGESHTFWMSTEGITQMRFSNGNWFDNDPSFFMTFNSELDPRVQQDDMTQPHGYMSFEAGNGSMSPSDQWYLYGDMLKVGATLTLHGHKIEVLKIVLGDRTTRVDGRIYTTGNQPTAHALIRVTKVGE